MPTSRVTLNGYTTDSGTAPGTHDGGNASAAFRHFAHAGRLIGVVDSFARPFAYLREDAGRVSVYTQGKAFFDRTVAHRPVTLLLQGRGCMADPRDRTRYAIVGLLSGADTTPNDRRNPPDVGVRGHNIGVRGFVPVAELPRRIAGASTAALLRNHDLGCGPPPGLPPRVGTAAKLPATEGWDRFADLYYGSHSWIGCPVRSQRPDPEAPTCGTPYAQYEAPPGLTPPGQQVSLLTANTTGVTGTHAGVVRALYRAGPMRVVDAIGYPDPNVPCQATARAQWVFGDVNPEAHGGGLHIWGWRARRIATAPPAAWSALAPGLAARPCGTVQPGAELFDHPTGACPRPGTRQLASSGAARVFREGSTTYVCDRSSMLYEALDDPATGPAVLAPPALDLAAGRVLDVLPYPTDARGRRGAELLVLDVASYVGFESTDTGVIVEAPAFGKVGSAVLYRGGAAYIGCTASCEVHVLGPGGPGTDRIVASGALVPTSLRVTGGRLRWTIRH
jgi:hypothetical protein